MSSTGAVELGPQPLVEIAVVVQAGERIGVGEMLEAGVDLRVVEGECGGVAEPAGELELVLVEAGVLTDPVDVQRTLERAARDQRNRDQRLGVGRSSRNERDPRVEVRSVREHGAAVLDRPAGDPLAEHDAVAEHLLLPLSPREHGYELLRLQIRLVDVQILVRHELGQRLRDTVDERLGALLGEDVVEHCRQPAVRLDERLGACGGLPRIGLGQI